MERITDHSTAKARHTEALIEYLADPGNEWMSKADLSRSVLGRDQTYINKTWQPSEFEREVFVPALKLRRSRYARFSAEVDRALIAKALEGDVAACKLFYQRLEGWNPAQRTEARIEVSGLTLADVLNGEGCPSKE